MSSITVRLFRPESSDDYDALAAIIRAAKPDYAQTVAELRDDDSCYIETGKAWGRLFALGEGGVPVGFAEYAPALWQPGTGKFYVNLLVVPEHQGLGVGKTLYAALIEALTPHEPTYLKISWREDMTRATRFFVERGYREVSRYYESRLDIAAFDAAPFAADFDRPLSAGFEIATWRDLQKRDPDASGKMWQVSMETSADVPQDEPFAPLDFAAFESLVMHRPNLDPDGFFVAIHTATGDYAGLSHIWRRQADNDVDTGLTGVKREYRRNGIALALKLRIIAWAKAGGFRYLRTGNDVSNRPMLEINERLGFAKEPAWIEYVWRPG